MVLPIAGSRRQIYFGFSCFRRQDWVLGTMTFVLHRDAKIFKVQWWICRKRPRHSYSDAGFILRTSRREIQIFFLWAKRSIENNCCNRLLITYILYHIFLWISNFFFFLDTSFRCLCFKQVRKPIPPKSQVAFTGFEPAISNENLLYVSMVGQAGLEPAMPFGAWFTVRWGYQFSYWPI